MAQIPPGVTEAQLKEFCASLSDEEFKDCFAGTEHLKYWLLGDFIYEQNPYMPDGELRIEEDVLEFDPKKPSLTSPKLQVHGRLKANTVDNPFCKRQDVASSKGVAIQQIVPKGPEKTIPKPPEAGGPHQVPRTYYFQVGVNTGEEAPDWDGKARKRRNVVKEIEIEYGPPIHEEDRDKPPHIIILYAGGNN